MADSRETHEQAEEWNCLIRGLECWDVTFGPNDVPNCGHIPLSLRRHHPFDRSHPVRTGSILLQGRQQQPSSVRADNHQLSMGSRTHFLELVFTGLGHSLHAWTGLDSL